MIGSLEEITPLSILFIECVGDGVVECGGGLFDGAVEAAAGGFGVAAAGELAADLVDVDFAFAAETSADLPSGVSVRSATTSTVLTTNGRSTRYSVWLWAAAVSRKSDCRRIMQAKRSSQLHWMPARGTLHGTDFGFGFHLLEEGIEPGVVDEGGEVGGHEVGAGLDGIEAEPSGVGDEAGHEGEGEFLVDGDGGLAGEVPQDFDAGGGGGVGINVGAEVVAAEVVVEDDDFFAFGF